LVIWRSGAARSPCDRGKPRHNPFADLPGSLANLTALTELDLSGTQLTAVPDWLANLTALTRLDLSGTQITAVPDWLGNLTALQTLNVDGTGLEDSGFANCPSCER